MVPDAGWPAIAGEPPTSRTKGMALLVKGVALRLVFSALIRFWPSVLATLPFVPKCARFGM